MLRIPVIASVGHHTDRTLIDDVAAVSCSTPTHAAEAAVPLHCGEARARLSSASGRLQAQGRRAVVTRARTLAALSRAPAVASWSATVGDCTSSCGRSGRARSAGSTLRDRDARRPARPSCRARRRRRSWPSSAGQASTRLALALEAHHPERTLERGYALVEGPDGEPVVSADAARTLDHMTLRLHDGTVEVEPR